MFCIPVIRADDPPADLARKVAHRETETKRARDQYTYRQTVAVEELDDKGGRRGQYREVRDVIFSPQSGRTEVMVGKPELTLQRLKLTEEDFADIRDIQPFVMTEERLWNYETKFRGDESMDGVDCWVLQVRPRQILEGMRLFDGMLWVSKTDFSVIRSEGEAVPQIINSKNENLFPRFTTLRRPVEGGFWFPAQTFADATLHFRGGPIRERLTIRFSDYKKFGAESSVTFEK